LTHIKFKARECLGYCTEAVGSSLTPVFSATEVFGYSNGTKAKCALIKMHPAIKLTAAPQNKVHLLLKKCSQICYTCIAFFQI